MSIEWIPRPFGRLPSGESVERYEAGTGSGMSAAVLTYGGIVQALSVPGADGKASDVVLGLSDLGGYLRQHPHFGAITGRVAGRISGARFSIGGREYRLAANNGANHLHGGLRGLDKRVWRAEVHGNALILHYRSPDGEEGYPGNADFAVTYRLTPQNELIIESEAVVDQPTPVSLTNHSYFNLAGEGAGTVEDHVLQISADEVVPTDDELTLSGRRERVDGGPDDFREPRRLGDALPGIRLQHGGDYMLRRGIPGELREVARVWEPRGMREMVVSTDEDCLQFYTGVFLDGSFTGKSGAPYGRHAGLCFECQGYPDGLTHPELGAILTEPGRPRRRKTVYRFGVRS